MDLPASELSAEQQKEGATVASMREKARDGYPSLAELMHSSPDNAIFRRFGELNMLHLLRLQAELQNMESELQKIREEDSMSNDPIRECYAKDFTAMRDNEEIGDSEQYEQLVRIGTKLQEYNAALNLVLPVTKAQEPTGAELKRLLSWLSRAKGGNSFLTGDESRVWQGNDTSEYITLFPRDLEDDAFTTFLGGRLLDMYHGIIGYKRRRKYGTGARDSELRKYSVRRIGKASNVAVAAVSSILPTLVILGLYFVKRMIVRIGLVILFTAIFSVALAVFTSARKVEIFSATAAFAAVEVVFIGSSSTNGTG
ncbi:hypothetical protein HBI70_177620 [Parastagonospora nodorum]|nr:hypothetical protein HBI09_211370 [Parastagonospora nodorum]KAH4925612.1 hypothetical protein HBH74_114900 [Parastagonospora nodorum]KAH4941788.1 hypothetical protein HBH73_155870 [Parastagonospora nodorum]KAH4999221.1 hypothetical protein HBI77_176690 [Parastagonospora nodorum]KAH5013337.1 hypothetical protein HBI74_186520 [Parastagonospora nodorum]